MPDIPVRYIHFDVSRKESYSLDSVGKHGFGKFDILITPPSAAEYWLICDLLSILAAIEIGPQPHGVVRSNIYTAMKVGVQHMLDWVHFFNSGTIQTG